MSNNQEVKLCPWQWMAISVWIGIALGLFYYIERDLRRIGDELHTLNESRKEGK